MDKKQCPACRTIKEHAEFYKRKNGRFSSPCIECSRKRCLEYQRKRRSGWVHEPVKRFDSVTKQILCGKCDEWKDLSMYPRSAYVAGNYAAKTCRSCASSIAIQRYRDRVNGGLCVRCGKRSPGVARYCAPCLTKHGAAMAKMALKPRAAEIAKRNMIEKLGGECVVCHIKSEYYTIYDFHHIKRSDKKAEVSNLLAARLIQDAYIEAEKCILVCANCHRAIHEVNSMIRKKRPVPWSRPLKIVLECMGVFSTPSSVSESLKEAVSA